MKKFLSILLAALMVLTCIPFVFAAETVASGNCGDNANWVLDDAGVLTITGTGKINVADNEGVIHLEEIPWYSYRGDILKVVISDGITSIGDSAFGYLSDLTDVSVPSSVTKIEGNAFVFCENIETIVIPDSVTAIESAAFMGCCRLKSITLSSALAAIDIGTFQECTALEEITLPDSVESIGEQAFFGCVSLKSVNFGSGLKSVADGAFKLSIVESEDEMLWLKEYYDSAPSSEECIDNLGIPLKALNDIITATDVGVKNVNYNGYEEDWEKVEVAENNDGLTCAEFTFITERTAEDESTGIGFVYDSDVFGKNLEVTVAESQSEGVFALIEEKSGAEKVKAYDFSFTGADAFPADGKLKVKIPVPDGFSAADCKVYYVNPETGAFENMNAEVENGYLVFETTHFSTYAVVDESTIPEPVELTFFEKVIEFFRNLFESIKNFFTGLFA